MYKFHNDRFQGYNRTSTSERKVNWKLNVSGRRVRCEVVDTSGQNGPGKERIVTSLVLIIPWLFHILAISEIKTSVAFQLFCFRDWDVPIAIIVENFMLPQMAQKTPPPLRTSKHREKLELRTEAVTSSTFLLLLEFELNFRKLFT